MVTDFELELRYIGLTLNAKKTTFHSTNLAERHTYNLQDSSHTTNEKMHFEFLGAHFHMHDHNTSDTQYIRTKVNKAFHANQHIWQSKNLSLKQKMSHLDAIIEPVALWAAATMVPNKEMITFFQKLRHQLARQITRLRKMPYESWIAYNQRRDTLIHINDPKNTFITNFNGHINAQLHIPAYNWLLRFAQKQLQLAHRIAKMPPNLTKRCMTYRNAQYEAHQRTLPWKMSKLRAPCKNRWLLWEKHITQAFGIHWQTYLAKFDLVTPAHIAKMYAIICHTQEEDAPSSSQAAP